MALALECNKYSDIALAKYRYTQSHEKFKEKFKDKKMKENMQFTLLLIADWIFFASATSTYILRS